MPSLKTGSSPSSSRLVPVSDKGTYVFDFLYWRVSLKSQTTFIPKFLAVIAFAVFSFASAQAQETRVGHVSSDRIMRESAPAQAAEEKIKREFSSRDKELAGMAERLKGMATKLDKDMSVLAESDRIKRQRELADLDREFQSKQLAFRQDLNQRRNEEIAAVVNRAQKAIKKIAETEKFDLILQDAIYFSPKVDITDKVIKAISK